MRHKDQKRLKCGGRAGRTWWCAASRRRLPRTAGAGSASATWCARSVCACARARACVRFCARAPLCVRLRALVRAGASLCACGCVRVRGSACLHEKIRTREADTDMITHPRLCVPVSRSCGRTARRSSTPSRSRGSDAGPHAPRDAARKGAIVRGRAEAVPVCAPDLQGNGVACGEVPPILRWGAFIARGRQFGARIWRATLAL